MHREQQLLRQQGGSWDRIGGNLLSMMSRLEVWSCRTVGVRVGIIGIGAVRVLVRRRGEMLLGRRLGGSRLGGGGEMGK